MSQKALQPIEQKQVDFYEDEITALQMDDGKVFVPIRPICDRLGINWNGQRQRIKRDTVLSEALTVCVTHTVQGNRDMLCLPLDTLPGFLFGVNENRVKVELKEPLIIYKREVHRVLSEAFIKNEVTHRPSTDIDELLKDDTDPTVVAYRTAMAVADLARAHLLMKASIADNSNRIASLDQRMQLIEADMGNSERYVTNSQAQDIRSAVQTIAFELSKQTGRNEFGGVWNEIQRQFEINSYKKLPAVKFDGVMSFLRQWYQALTDEDDIPL